MSILTELNTVLPSLGIAVETGLFSGKAPNEYIVVTPLADTFELYGDNKPIYETQEVRLSLYSNGNYVKRKYEIIITLLKAEFTITDRQYIGYEVETGYHHYSIDISKEYYFQEGDV